ncbi:MAG: hypothetical protein WA894_01065, partial [Candidatus Acidiferrum sp.]
MIHTFLGIDGLEGNFGRGDGTKGSKANRVYLLLEAPKRKKVAVELSVRHRHKRRRCGAVVSL